MAAGLDIFLQRKMKEQDLKYLVSVAQEILKDETQSKCTKMIIKIMDFLVLKNLSELMRRKY